MWAWFTEMDVQSISNGPAMELARVKWGMSASGVSGSNSQAGFDHYFTIGAAGLNPANVTSMFLGEG